MTAGGLSLYSADRSSVLHVRGTSDGADVRMDGVLPTPGWVALACHLNAAQVAMLVQELTPLAAPEAT